MAIKTNIEALRDAMAAAMRQDSSIIVMGEDVGQRGGVFRATEGLYAEFGPHRVIDSPLSELSIVGVGIGMALNGLLPICEIQFADFIHLLISVKIYDHDIGVLDLLFDSQCPLEPIG